MAPGGRKAQKTDTVAGTNGEGTQSALRQAERRTLRGKRGGLANMPNMPLDILIEIFSHLEPRDLLHLARTSKTFRRYLMNRASAFLWNTARRSIEGLPDCPSHLSEPAYANLVFSPYCHGCLKKNVKNILWAFRVRYCNSCRKSKVDDHFYQVALRPSKDRHPTVYFGDLLTSITERRKMYHLPEFYEVEDELRALASQPEEETLYIERRKALVKEINAHAQLCLAWSYERSASRTEELRDVKESRLSAILQKLRESGWEEEVGFMESNDYQDLKTLAQVRMAKPLTERAWEKMRDDVIALMETSRQERILQERIAFLKGRLSALSTFISEYYAKIRRNAARELMPRFIDFAYMQEFRAVVEAPETTEVTVNTFRGLRHLLPDLIVRWQADVKAEFTALVTKEIDVPAGVDPVALAAASFSCNYCGSTDLRYPGIVAHPCLYPSQFVSTSKEVYDVAIINMEATCKWSAASIKFGSEFGDIRFILALCDLLFDRTTVEEMDRLDLRFCIKQPTRPNSRLVTTWRGAIPRVHQHDPRFLESFELADQEERNNAMEVEASRYDLLVTQYRGKRNWGCSMCTSRYYSRRSVEDIQLHMASEHAMDNATVENGDIFLHPSSKPMIPGDVWLISDHPDADLSVWEQFMLDRAKGHFCSLAPMD